MVLRGDNWCPEKRIHTEQEPIDEMIMVWVSTSYCQWYESARLSFPLNTSSSSSFSRSLLFLQPFFCGSQRSKIHLRFGEIIFLFIFFSFPSKRTHRFSFSVFFFLFKAYSPLFFHFHQSFFFLKCTHHFPYLFHHSFFFPKYFFSSKRTHHFSFFSISFFFS